MGQETGALGRGPCRALGGNGGSVQDLGVPGASVQGWGFLQVLGASAGAGEGLQPPWGGPMQGLGGYPGVPGVPMLGGPCTPRGSVWGLVVPGGR